MKRGEDVVEQVFHAEAHAVEIALRCGREIRAAFSVIAISHAVIAKPKRYAGRSAIHEVETAQMRNCLCR